MGRHIQKKKVNSKKNKIFTKIRKGIKAIQKKTALTTIQRKEIFCAFTHRQKFWGLALDYSYYYYYYYYLSTELWFKRFVYVI